MGRPPLVGGTSNSWDSANSCQLRGWLPQWTNTACDGRFHGRWQRPRCSHWPRVDRRWTSCRYNTLIVPSTHDAISWGMVMYENENNEGEVSISCAGWTDQTATAAITITTTPAAAVSPQNRIFGICGAGLLQDEWCPSCHWSNSVKALKARIKRNYENNSCKKKFHWWSDSAQRQSNSNEKLAWIWQLCSCCN